MYSCTRVVWASTHSPVQRFLRSAPKIERVFLHLMMNVHRTFTHYCNSIVTWRFAHLHNSFGILAPFRCYDKGFRAFISIFVFNLLDHMRACSYSFACKRLVSWLLGHQRIHLYIRTCMQRVAGTLTEVGLAWQARKPIVVMRGAGSTGILASTRIDNRREDEVGGADSPEEAFNLMMQQVYTSPLTPYLRGSLYLRFELQ